MYMRLIFSREFLFECFQREQVFTKNEAVIEDIVMRDAVRGMI